jgi:hypothetical protein
MRSQTARGIYGLFYSPNAKEVRAFIRDKLGVVRLIFDMVEADLGVDPSDRVYHSISL